MTATNTTGVSAAPTRLANCSIAEQTIELLLGNAVVLARASDQAAAIDDRDIAAFAADEAGPLHAEHHGQELLRERKTHPVACGRASSHPAAASLPNGMQLIARGGLRDLVEDGVSVMKHNRSQRSASAPGIGVLLPLDGLRHMIRIRGETP